MVSFIDLGGVDGSGAYYDLNLGAGNQKPSKMKSGRN